MALFVRLIFLDLMRKWNCSIVVDLMIKVVI